MATLLCGTGGMVATAQTLAPEPVEASLPALVPESAQAATQAVTQAATQATTQAATQAVLQSAIANLPNDWYAVLPDCPCHADVAAASLTWQQGPKACSAVFHPGAVVGFRSTQTYASVPGTAHGQQCCYDAAGQLITQGPGAGTPDLWSPMTHVLEHQVEDVLPWLNLGWQAYNQAWVPNQGRACSANDAQVNAGFGESFQL